MKVIILAGGSGTRLWPLSRKRFPKQFINIKDGEHTLFQQTFLRSLLLTNIENIYIVTIEMYKFLILDSIEELGYKLKERNIIIEPEGKNTLPAICLAIKAINTDENEPLVIFPSDHIIVESNSFVDSIQAAKDLSKDSIVTFGIKPTTPHTGYGYIAPSFENSRLNGYEIKEFKEKPTYEMAVKYLEAGYLWNSGIFLFTTKIFLQELKLHSYSIFKAFNDNSSNESYYQDISNPVSIDYGILEKSKKIVVVPIDVKWNDLGSFDSFYEVLDSDPAQNICNAENILIESHNNLIRASSSKLVSLIGIDDLIVIDHPDVLLLCKKSESQKVKEVVSLLRERNDSRVDYHVQDYRPWGNYITLNDSKPVYKVKKICILVGHEISCHLHYHRSENWVIVKGSGKVTIDNVEKFLHEGENIFIKAGQKHKLENLGKIDLEMIEIQIGDCLEEDDIIRF